MTKFVQTTHGWINVATIAQAIWQNENERYVLYDARGDSLGLVSNFGFDPRDTLEDTYVPCTGVIATLISVPSNARPTADDIYVWRLHVIAWKLIGDGFAEPVLTESTGGGEVVLIECPDGRLLDAENCSYENLDAAKAAALAKAQEEWDAKQKPAP